MTRDGAPFRSISPETVADDDDVHHFDQLAEPAQLALETHRARGPREHGGQPHSDLLADGGAGDDPTTLPGIEPGDVVVFTEYYRVIGR